MSLRPPNRLPGAAAVRQPVVDPMIGRTIDAQYLVKMRLGRGGMGNVYLAHDERMNRDVAVKVLRSSFDEDGPERVRFTRELEVLTKLQHPNTIRVFDFGQLPDGTPYYVMEYLQCGSLEDVVSAEAPLSSRRALHIASQVARALVEAHAKKIIHRDIKPGNILVGDVAGERDFAKLVDFGIVRQHGLSIDGAAGTGTGVAIGTPAYMAPEQGRGASVDARADQYSLGCVVYRMLTGKQPFTCDDAVALIVCHATEPRPRLDPLAVPAAVRRLVHRMMAIDANERYSSPAELVSAIESVERHRSTSGTGLDDPPATHRVRAAALSLQAARERVDEDAGAGTEQTEEHRQQGEGRGASRKGTRAGGRHRRCRPHLHEGWRANSY